VAEVSHYRLEQSLDFLLPGVLPLCDFGTRECNIGSSPPSSFLGGPSEKVVSRFALGQNARVFELNVDGSALVYSTYLGGTRSDFGKRIAFDPLGNAYMASFATSTNFPITAAGFQQSRAGRNGSFVAKVAPQSFVTVYKHPVGTTSAPVKRTLTDIGTTSVAISRIYIVGANSGDFAETNNCGAALGAGPICKISITFTPTAVGARRGALVDR
jgi:hypothetical protein